MKTGSLVALRRLATWGARSKLGPRVQASTSETPQSTFVHQHPAMEISNPRRILAVGAPDSGVLSLLKGMDYQVAQRS